MALKLGQELKKIADAIRTAKGTTETFKPKNFATEIAKLCYLDEGTSGLVESIEGQTITPTTITIASTASVLFNSCFGVGQITFFNSALTSFRKCLSFLSLTFFFASLGIIFPPQGLFCFLMCSTFLTEFAIFCYF